MNFHILIASKDRPSLKATVLSALKQLKDNDRITVVYDGVENVQPLEIDDERIILIKEKKHTGFWGHPIRNKYLNQLQGDYLLMMDDDDIYVPEAFDLIRQSIDDQDLIVFNIYSEVTRSIMPMDENGRPTLIRTCQGVIKNTGVIPYIFENFYGGDVQFYHNLVNSGMKVKYVKEVIVRNT
jgi:hypothetical protein